MQKAETTINVPIDKVWYTLVNPDTIKKYMFVKSVISDLNKGSKLIWKGKWQGKSHEDKGEIFQIIPKIFMRAWHSLAIKSSRYFLQTYLSFSCSNFLIVLMLLTLPLPVACITYSGTHKWWFDLLPVCFQEA